MGNLLRDTGLAHGIVGAEARRSRFGNYSDGSHSLMCYQRDTICTNAVIHT